MTAGAAGASTPAPRHNLDHIGALAYLRAHRLVALAVFAYFLVAFGGEAFSPTLNVDDYAHVTGGIRWEWAGRWGLTLVHQLLLGGAIAPLPAFVAAGAIQAVAGLLLAYLLNARTPLVAGLCAALYAAFPYWIDAFNFDTAIVGYPLANALGLLGIVGLMSAGWAKKAGGVAALVLALAVYQPALGLVVATALLAETSRALARAAAGERPWLRPARLAATWGLALAVALLLYFASVWISLALVDGPLSPRGEVVGDMARLGLALER